MIGINQYRVKEVYFLEFFVLSLILIEDLALFSPLLYLLRVIHILQHSRYNIFIISIINGSYDTAAEIYQIP